ncbi:hypothetical protein ACWEXQ_05775 [Staphylococcus shinii]|uniref:hypothetical protein n=1 Tax=Staphylococcus shinii TaxID=2912228 RepID=UPI0035123B76
MKFRKLWMLGLSSFIILSACGQNADDNDKKDNNKAHKSDKNSDETEKQSNEEIAENNQNSKNQSQGETNATKTTTEENNQNSKPITIDEAKSIAFNSEDLVNFTQNKDNLIYNKDKSNNDEIFIETPFGGINESVKHHAIIDRNTGEIISTGSAGTHADGLVKTNDGKVDKKAYNITLDFYNTYIYKKGMPEFETATSDVPEQKYKKLSKIVGNYWQEEQGYENGSNQATSNNNQSQTEKENNQSDDENTTNEQNKDNTETNNDESNQEQNNEEQQENSNEEASQNEEREDPNQQIEQPSSEDKQNSDATQENNNQNNDENIDDNNFENEQSQDVESKSSVNDKETSNGS